jgi:hypothetical protein
VCHNHRAGRYQRVGAEDHQRFDVTEVWHRRYHGGFPVRKRGCGEPAASVLWAGCLRPLGESRTKLATADATGEECGGDRVAISEDSKPSDRACPWIRGGLCLSLVFATFRSALCSCARSWRGARSCRGRVSPDGQHSGDESSNVGHIVVIYPVENGAKAMVFDDSVGYEHRYVDQPQL